MALPERTEGVFKPRHCLPCFRNLATRENLLETTQFASLDVFSFERSADVLLVLILGGTGYLYGGMIGAVVFKLMQDALIDVTAQYWQFWIGLVLVLIVLGGERVKRLAAAAGGRIARLVGRRPKLDAKAP